MLNFKMKKVFSLFVLLFIFVSLFVLSMGNGIKAANVPFSANVEISKPTANGIITVKINQISTSENVTKISIPVWSDKNGQDDIKWYEAVKQSDGSFLATLNTMYHKYDIGTYNIHLYAVFASGVQYNFYGGTFEVPTINANVVVSPVNEKGIFSIHVKDFYSPTGVSSVQIPVWSVQNGQDDIKRYDGIKQSDGSYIVNVDIRNHNNADAGEYYVHVYATDFAGVSQFISSTLINIPYIEYNSEASKVTENGIFTVRIKDINAPRGLSKIRVPIWSNNDKEGTIKWYEAVKQSDGSYLVNGNTAYHKYQSGSYSYNIYFTDNTGIERDYPGGRFEIPFVTGKIKTTQVDSKGIFSVNVTDIYYPTGVKKMEFAVWSSVNGTDDLKWYEAVKQSDGTYSLNIDIKNHNNSDIGDYNIHVYVTDFSGKKDAIGTAVVNVPSVEFKSSVSEIASNGTFNIVISDIKAPRGVNKIRVPLWSNNDKNNTTYWYDAVKQSDGTFLVKANTAYHNYQGGTYGYHIYFTDNTNVERGYSGGTFDVSYIDGKIEFGSYQDNGTFTVRLKDIYAPNGLKDPVFEVWSDVFGKDDVQVYKGVKQVDGTYLITVDIKNKHCFDKGKYYAKAYGYTFATFNNYFSFATGEIDIPKVSGSMEVTPLTEPPTRTFDVILRDLQPLDRVTQPIVEVVSPSGIKIPNIPVKQADGSYISHINVKDYKYEGGTYKVTSVVKDPDGGRSLIGESQVVVPYMKAASVKAVGIDATNFQVLVSGIDAPAGVKEINATVYAIYNNDSDKKVYTLSKNSEGNYFVNVPMSNHGMEPGDYSISVTGTGTDLVTANLGTAIASMRSIEGTIVCNGLTDDGRFTINVTPTAAPRGISEIRAYVWVDGQKDSTQKMVYLTRGSDGVYRANVSAQDFGSKIGLYKLHVYGRDNYSVDNFMGQGEIRIDSIRTKFSWPVPNWYNISSPYGPRGSEFHRGIDIASIGIEGAPVVAAKQGRVISAGPTFPDDGFGNKVIIDHGNKLQTLYGHLSFVNVRVGDEVFQGAVIGNVGNTGQSNGAHLHFQVTENGDIFRGTVNPMNYF